MMTDFNSDPTTYSTGVNIVDSSGALVPRAEPQNVQLATIAQQPPLQETQPLSRQSVPMEVSVSTST
jgi:hypothetical protein